jgi:hypothetical protein
MLKGELQQLSEARPLIDLSGLTFTPEESPEAARKWGGEIGEPPRL